MGCLKNTTKFSGTKMNSAIKNNLSSASKSNPCPHCGKPDWCYSVWELTVCKRGNDPAPGWTKTSKQDKEGHFYYAPVQQKPVRPKSRKDYFYSDHNGNRNVKVTRIDDGTGKKTFAQSHWDGHHWVSGNPETVKPNIPIYRYQEVRNAIAQGELIFIVEGEEVADIMKELGLSATTFIGGSGKYRSYGTGYKEDLAGASVVLCPDRDLPGVKYMEEIAEDFPNAQWLYAPPNPFYWEHLPKSQGLDIGDWVKDGATTADILSCLSVKKYTSVKSEFSNKSIVYVDNGLLSTSLSTPQEDDESKIQAIVGVVYTIINSNLSEFIERQKLNMVYRQYKDVVDRKLFDSIVASQRVKLKEVLPEDELRLKSLMDYAKAKIDWDEVLPAPLARDIKHDADILNIDPVMIWQALLPAVSSLAGGFTLDEYGGIPAINWTCTVIPSGGGKTRADKLVFSPLRKMQISADTAYKEQAKEYKRAITQYEKAGESDAVEPEKPGLRKYLFEVATIQSVLKRLSEQGTHGSLWGRDEIKGLFGSLNQFSGIENEATEIVLSLWDRKPTFVDRVDIENSFTVDGAALSITGGIQNHVFRKAFKDANDGNGMQARFLFAVPEERNKKYVKGYCHLSDRLPVLYEWLNNLSDETVKMSPDAQNYFAKLVGIIGDQIGQVSHAGIRTWMNKLDTHVLRIALVLHLIECFYSPSSTNIKQLSLATLKRAVAFAQYYRSAFHILQEKVSVSDDIASILLQIHTAALAKHPDGISARDVYKDSRPIQNRAKSAGREAGAYVSDLFEKMASMGYGEVVRKGRTVRFIAYQKPDLEKTFLDADNVDNSSKCDQKTLSEQDKDCLHQRRQSGIVCVDNENNTTVRTQIECQKEQEKSEGESAEEDAISLLDIEASDGDIAGFVGCQVEVRTLSGSVKYCGEMTSYDNKNGFITVATTEGASIAHFREAFVKGL
jgi:Protein of unknown function (DUF3987)